MGMAASTAEQNFDARAATRWSAEPSTREVLLLAILTAVVFFTTLAATTNISGLVDSFGDTPGYVSIASAIHSGNFQGVVIKQFWGVSYAAAAVSLLGHIPDRTAFLLVCFVSSLTAVGLAYRLWGGWIAGFFCVLSFDWMQRSFLGGSEPLFLALLFAAFLAARRQRWWLASLLASLATVVRPLGFFALVGIGLTLLWKREIRQFICATAIGLFIGILYALPLAYQFGDPLATVHSYQAAGQPGQHLFGIPFYAIIKGTLLYPAPWTNLVLTFSWICFVVAGAVAMIASPFRQYARTHPVEIIFAVPYLFSTYMYNSPYFARGNFARFAIPVLPFVLLALYRWIPKDRRSLWALGVVMPVLAAASAVGVANFVGMLRHVI